MYPITSAVKALFDAEQRQVLRITGTDKNGTAISITDANVMEGGFGIDRYSCNGEKLEVGTAIASEMTLSLDNRQGQFNGVVFEGTELFVEVGIADWTQSNPTITYIPCGYFTPDMQPRRLNNINLNCLDRMTRFDAAVDAAALTFPATVAGLVGQVCTLCGVTLAGSISGLTNAGVSIAALPSVNGDITYRNLLQWCAGIMATNAWFDWNGQLRFTWYNGASTGYATTTANRFDSDYYEDDLTITGVVYTNASGVEIVEGTDEYAIDLTGNALVGPLVATVLPAINTALNGFSYRPFTATVINAPYLWPMDAVTFTDKDGNSYSSALTNVAYGINGVTAIESKGLTAALNARTQPVGVTKEQAQLISQAMEQVETDIDESLTQQEIFNRLTDNGAAQGLLLYNGQLYVNASYIRSGTLVLGGLDNVNGLLQILDADGNVAIQGDHNGLVVGTGTISNWYYHERAVEIEEGMLRFIGGNSFVGKMYFNNENYPMLVIDPSISSGGLRLFGNQSRKTVETPGQPSLEQLYRPWIDLTTDGLITINYHQLYLIPLFADSTITLGSPLSVGNGGTGATTPAAARTNLGAVAKAGDRMTGNLSIGKTTPAILFYNNNTDTTWAGIVYEVVDSGGNNRLAFAIRKDGSAGQEAYFLPAPDTHSAQTNYAVLTSKSLVSVNQGGTGANNAADARTNLGITPANIQAAYAINIASGVSEWSDIFQALNVLPTSTPGVIYAASGPASQLTGGKLTSYIKGVVTRLSDSVFDFMVQRGSNSEYIYSFRVTGLTSSAGTPGTVYRFVGTAI